MTIDIAEIARLRRRAAGVAPELALLDELEKARAERDALDAHYKFQQQHIVDAQTERDAAHALLREVVNLTVCFLSKEDADALRARIVKHLGDA